MTTMNPPSAAIEGVRAGGLAIFALVPVCAFAQQTAAGSSSPNRELQEIVVTAQKREERLQDVPVPVTAISADSLLEQNQPRAQDFFSSIPGVDLQFINGRSNLAIRGITTGPATGNPVVGYTVDDVPYGSSAGVAGLFGSAPDLDPSELARIEVLRGPQGTLYGASSIGGLVKYVTVDPSTDRISGTVGADAHTIFGGHGPGYNVRGSINVPLNDTLAVRASAFTRDDPGYIDNVITGVRGVNKVEVSGGRLAALWRPSEVLSVKLSALYQDTKVFGSSDVDTSLGSWNLQSDHFGAGRSDWKNQVYSAIVTARLGRSELTSVSSYTYNPSFDNLDFSASGLNAVLPSVYPVGVDPMATILHQDYSTKKLTQEVRLATPIGERVDWLVGAFYTHENTHYLIEALATDPANGTVYGVPILWRDSLIFAEYAAFTDLTARFTDRFDVQLGARWSTNQQDLHHRQWTFDQPGGLFTDPTSRDHALTYLFTPRFRITSEHMVYARIATGYRPGGPNAVCDNAAIPCQYRSDKTTNYELGAKGDAHGRAFSYDLSLYHIDWKDIQVTQVDSSGTFEYNANASRARSRGVELSLESRPLNGLTLALWGAWTDAQLREGFSGLSTVYAATGDRLPYSTRFSGRFSVDQESPLTADARAFGGVSVSYVGDRKGEFVPTPEEEPLRQTYPAYAQVDLHAGVKTEDWRVNLFVQNATNKRGVTGGGYNNLTNFNPYWLNYIQPRTFGLALERSF
jgi:iron complex outermembrane receptor protein